MIYTEQFLQNRLEEQEMYQRYFSDLELVRKLRSKIFKVLYEYGFEDYSELIVYLSKHSTKQLFDFCWIDHAFWKKYIKNNKEEILYESYNNYDDCVDDLFN